MNECTGTLPCALRYISRELELVLLNEPRQLAQVEMCGHFRVRLHRTLLNDRRFYPFVREHWPSTDKTSY